MVRLMVTSATYRQDSRLRPELREVDPDNRLLACAVARGGSRPSSSATTPWRSPACSTSTIGGPSVKPYQPAGYYANLQFPDRDYVADTRRAASTAAASTCTGSGRSSTRCSPIRRPVAARNASPAATVATRRSRR